MDVSGWLLSFIILFIVLLVLIGQPSGSKGPSVELSTGVLKRGMNRVAGMGKSAISTVEEATKEGFGKRHYKSEDPHVRENLGKRHNKGEDPHTREDFALMGETYPEMKDRVDVYGTDVPIGEETAARLHAHAFLTDVTNRSESVRLSTPQVQRETPAHSFVQWTGAFEGQEAIQSNPFVKVAIRNHPAHEGRDPFSYERI